MRRIVGKKKKPPKIDNLCEKIRDCLKHHRYRQSRHAMERVDKRRVTFLAVLYVLETGYREEAKDSYEEVFQNWKYSMRGKTEEDVNLRVIITIDKENIIIITVVNLDITED